MVRAVINALIPHKSWKLPEPQRIEASVRWRIGDPVLIDFSYRTAASCRPFLGRIFAQVRNRATREYYFRLDADRDGRGDRESLGQESTGVTPQPKEAKPFTTEARSRGGSKIFYREFCSAPSAML
jgi:hypothetical protein